jgi:hypothetical protein
MEIEKNPSDKTAESEQLLSPVLAGGNRKQSVIGL